MADTNQKIEKRNQANTPAVAMPQDYYSLLVKVIGEVSTDPTLMRNLVYELARQNLKPESDQNRTVPELEEALKLERAIQRVESSVARRLEQSQHPSLHVSIEPTSEDAYPFWGRSPDLNKNPKTVSDESNLAEERLPPSTEQPTSGNVALPVSDNVVIMAPERTSSGMDHRIRISVDRHDHPPLHSSNERRSGILSFVQLVSAAALGVAFVAVIAGWAYMHRQAALTVPVAAVQPEPQPVLPFPLPKNYGVYAGNNGQLIELESLPIKVPSPRVLVSAEITKPSKTTVTGTNLAFVVFRRELINSAPEMVSMRVVARVSRDMTFTNGKPTITPIEGSWRIRAKSYEFRVSPLEGNREMIVIQPDPEFVFPAGRYALVLNGFGYDFTVAGPIKSSDQCLEQVQVLNGTVLAECTKS